MYKLKQMKLKPGLGVFYTIWSGNTAGLFYSSQANTGQQKTAS